MHGFFGSYGQAYSWDIASLLEKRTLVTRQKNEGAFHLLQATLPKFLEDKYFFEEGGCFLAVEGVLFVADKPNEALARYRKGETVFWDTWRGSFAGILYDRNTDTLLLFNDHIGSKMLFYAQVQQDFLFSSDLPILTDVLRPKGIGSYNGQFAWSMLSFGYSPLDETPISGVHRLGAGQYLCIRGEKAEQRTYHRFTIVPNALSEQENIQHVEILFRQAVQRVLDKNRQYGLKHTAALSAGLDSRMSVCLARELTNEPIDVVTYSQTGFYDEQIPKDIARQWQLSMHFTPLDGGDYLQAIDETNRVTGGIVAFAGAAQVLDGFSSLDGSRTGVVLTGMIGDIVLSSRLKKDSPSYAGLGALSTRWLSNVRSVTDALRQLYPMQELYYLYVRGFNCADLGSPLVLQTTGESYSPFYDVDLLQFCLSVPLSQRYNYRLYDRWIAQYHPQAAQWAHNGTRQIGKSVRKVTIAQREIPLNDLPKRIVWYLSKKLHIYNFYQDKEGESMNPMDSWYAASPSLREVLDSYFAKHINLLDFSDELKQAASDLYRTGTVMEKIQVLTLLASLRLNRLSVNDGIDE